MNFFLLINPIWVLFWIIAIALFVTVIWIILKTKLLSKSTFKSITNSWIAIFLIVGLFFISTVCASGILLANERTKSGWEKATQQGQMQHTIVDDDLYYGVKTFDSSSEKINDYYDYNINPYLSVSTMPTYYDLAAYEYTFSFMLDTDGDEVGDLYIPAIPPSAFLDLFLTVYKTYDEKIISLIEYLDLNNELLINLKNEYLATSRRDLINGFLFLFITGNLYTDFVPLSLYSATFELYVNSHSVGDPEFNIIYKTYQTEIISYWEEMMIYYQNDTLTYTLDKALSEIQQVGKINVYDYKTISCPSDYGRNEICEEQLETYTTYDFSDMVTEYNPSTIYRERKEGQENPYVIDFYRMDQFESDDNLNQLNRLLYDDVNKLPTNNVEIDPVTNHVIIDTMIFEQFAIKNDLTIGDTLPVSYTTNKLFVSSELLDYLITSGIWTSVSSFGTLEGNIFVLYEPITIDFRISQYMYMPNYQYPIISYSELLVDFNYQTLAIINYDLYNIIFTPLTVSNNILNFNRPSKTGELQIGYTNLLEEEIANDQVHSDYKKEIDQKNNALDLIICNFILTKNSDGYYDWEIANDPTQIVGSESNSFTSHFLFYKSDQGSLFYDNEYILDYNDYANNFILGDRFYEVEGNIKFSTILSYTLIVIFLIIDMIVIFVILRKKILNDMPTLGTLKALGYKSNHISVGYIAYPIVIVLFGGILGFLVGILVQHFWVHYLLQQWIAVEFVHVNFFNFFLITSLIIIPMIILCVFSIFIAWLTLRKNTIKMINNEDNYKPNILVKTSSKIGTGASFSLAYSTKNGLRALGKSSLLFITIFGLTFFIAFSLVGGNLAKKAVSDITSTYHLSSIDYYSNNSTYKSVYQGYYGDNYAIYLDEDFSADPLAIEDENNIYQLTEEGYNYVYSLGLIDSFDELTALNNKDEVGAGLDSYGSFQSNGHFEWTETGIESASIEIFNYLDTTSINKKFIIPISLVELIVDMNNDYSLEGLVKFANDYNNRLAFTWLEANAFYQMYLYLQLQFGIEMQYVTLGYIVNGYDQFMSLYTEFNFDYTRGNNETHVNQYSYSISSATSFDIYGSSEDVINNYIFIESATGNKNIEQDYMQAVEDTNNIYLSGGTPTVPVIMSSALAKQMNLQPNDVIEDVWIDSFSMWAEEYQHYYYWTANAYNDLGNIHSSDTTIYDEPYEDIVRDNGVNGKIYSAEWEVIEIMDGSLQERDPIAYYRYMEQVQYYASLDYYAQLNGWTMGTYRAPEFDVLIVDNYTSYYPSAGALLLYEPNLDYEHNKAKVFSSFVKPYSVNLAFSGFDQEPNLQSTFTCSTSVEWNDNLNPTLSDVTLDNLLIPCLVGSINLNSIQNTAQRTYQSFQIVIWYFIGFGLLIAFMFALVIIYEVITTTKKESATLKALGYSKWKISILVVLPYCLIMFIAFFVAIPATLILFKIIVAIIFSQFGVTLPLYPSMLTYFLVLFFVILMSFITYILSLFIFSKINPADALKH